MGGILAQVGGPVFPPTISGQISYAPRPQVLRPFSFQLKNARIPAEANPIHTVAIERSPGPAKSRQTAEEWARIAFPVLCLTGPHRAVRSEC